MERRTSSIIVTRHFPVETATQENPKISVEMSVFAPGDTPIETILDSLTEMYNEIISECLRKL